MPLCFLYTNAKLSDLDGNIQERIAKCISDATQISIDFIFVVLQTELPAFCAGSTEPSMICQIHAKKIFEEEKIVDVIYSKMFETLKETTKMPGKRIVVELIAVPDAMARLGD